MSVKIMTPNNSTVNRELVALNSLIINNKKELVTVTANHTQSPQDDQTLP